MYFVDAAVRHLTPAQRERALTLSNIPSQILKVTSARVPATAYSALWLAVARELDDEFFGLDSRAMKVGSFALTAQAIVSCSNLERALSRMLRAFRVFLNDIHGELQVEGNEAVVRLTSRIADAADERFAYETLLVLIHGLSCWLLGRRIPLTKVSFVYKRPAEASEYSLMFCDNLTFEAEQTSLHFDGALLDAPVIQNAKALRQFLLTAPQSVFLKYRNDESWTAQVRRHLRTGITDPATWPRFETVSRALGITPTTLRRRLETEGESFQSIKDALRNDLAVDYLCHTYISIDEIGPALGYHDASAFHRAFRRWNDISPGEYRKRIRTTQDK